MSIHIPKAAVVGVTFEIEHLGMEQAEAEEDVLIGDHETLLRPTAVVTVKDPEAVYAAGFNVRFAFRNEYYAKLFTKKLTDLLGPHPL